MIRSLYRCGVLFVLLAALTGGAYPLGVTLIAQGCFPHAACGSLVKDHGHVVGSALIGQAFTRPEYFWSRPSAAGYNAAGSSGSNLGPTNPVLLDAVAARAQDLGASAARPVPVDLVTASASGLDPDISPAAALFQVARVAQARGVPETVLEQLVAVHTQERLLGIWGERRVHVLELNRALDALPTVR
ncbi:MAG: potassium-transporting ATPase subunit KdpC [Planctomycetaceae bacterium]|nr:potassium-transporting ATPase subunit KdpC [Planctomycetaceae bacterium]